MHISNDPLHGITLEMIVAQLVERYGWADLAKRMLCVGGEELSTLMER